MAARAMGARAAWRDLACGRALVLERGRLRSVFRGPVWAAGVMPAERRRDLRRLARWLGATVATPEDPVTGLGLVPLLTPLHHAIWDLRSDLRAGLAGNWRASLMRSERAGLRVRRGGRATLEALMSAEATQVVSEGAFGAPVEETRIAYMRYVGQGHEIPVPLPPRALTAADVAGIRALYDAEYARFYDRPVP
ncbi:MAG: hypothetical protein ACK4ST_16785, partial [Elioraea tepidiphila]